MSGWSITTGATMPCCPTAAPTGLDPVVRAAISAVWDAAPGYQYLIGNLAGGRYQVIGQELFAATGAYGTTANDYHAILLDNGLLASDPRNGGRVLAHARRNRVLHAPSWVSMVFTISGCRACAKPWRSKREVRFSE